MMLLRGKLTAPACHPTKLINKVELTDIGGTPVPPVKYQKCHKKYVCPIKMTLDRSISFYFRY